MDKDESSPAGCGSLDFPVLARHQLSHASILSLSLSNSLFFFFFFPPSAYSTIYTTLILCDGERDSELVRGLAACPNARARLQQQEEETGL